MPIAQTELLFKLIKSLDKSEKRHFKLYVKRLASNEDGLFIQLFDLLDKAHEADDNKFRKKLKLKSQSQYANLKRHLYGQVIKSLRMINISRDSSIYIREQLDYAAILYKKGLYEQSLLLLERMKDQAKTGHNNLLLLQIIELEKKIESRHITRSRQIKDRIESLLRDSGRLRAIVSRTSALSDLSLNIQGLYIKYGFAKSRRDIELYHSYFDQHLHHPLTDMSFYESVLWHQSNVWLHYMCLDFSKSLEHAQSWVECFQEEKSMLDIDPDLYMRGLHYMLTNAFYIKDLDKFSQAMSLYEKFRQDRLGQFNEGSMIIDFIYFWNARLNEMIMNNDYSDLTSVEEEVHNKLNLLESKLDQHRIQVYNYKLSMIHMYLGDYSKALDYLNDILHSKSEYLRSDIFSYTRLLHLICHYALGNFNLIPSLLPSVRSGFQSREEWNKTLELIFGFIRKGTKAMNFGLQGDIRAVLNDLDDPQDQPFSQLPMIYFDFKNWFHSLLLNVSVQKARESKSNR